MVWEHNWKLLIKNSINNPKYEYVLPFRLYIFSHDWHSDEIKNSCESTSRSMDECSKRINNWNYFYQVFFFFFNRVWINMAILYIAKECGQNQSIHLLRCFYLHWQCKRMNWCKMRLLHLLRCSILSYRSIYGCFSQSFNVWILFQLPHQCRVIIIRSKKKTIDIIWSHFNFVFVFVVIILLSDRLIAAMHNVINTFFNGSINCISVVVIVRAIIHFCLCFQSTKQTKCFHSFQSKIRANIKVKTILYFPILFWNSILRKRKEGRALQRLKRI